MLKHVAGSGLFLLGAAPFALALVDAIIRSVLHYWQFYNGKLSLTLPPHLSAFIAAPDASAGTSW